jgi:hypothetical protein
VCARDGAASDLLATAADADGRLVLFAFGRSEQGDREVWQLQQTAPDAGWSHWRSFGRPAADVLLSGPESMAGVSWPTLVSDGHGRLQLYSLAPPVAGGKATLFYGQEQVTPSGDQWISVVNIFRVQPDYVPHPAGGQPPDEPPSRPPPAP